MITDILFYVVGVVIVYFAYKVVKGLIIKSDKCSGCPAESSCKKNQK